MIEHENQEIQETDIVRKEKVTLKNIYYYIQGNLRHKIYYSKYFKFLMRNVIREQIEFRINSMDRECFMDGQCKICKCETTALQMSNKACRKPCYPAMIPSSTWRNLRSAYKNTNYIKKDFPALEFTLNYADMYSEENTNTLISWIVDFKEKKFIRKNIMEALAEGFEPVTVKLKSDE